MSCLFISLPLDSPWSVKGSFDIKPCRNLLDWFNGPCTWSTKLLVPLPTLVLLKSKTCFHPTFPIKKAQNIQLFGDVDNKGWRQRSLGDRRAGRVCAQTFFKITSLGRGGEGLGIENFWIVQTKHSKCFISLKRYDDHIWEGSCPR